MDLPFGGDDAVNPNGTNKILGLQVAADGVMACAGDGIFCSQDGTSWLQINRTGVSSSGEITTYGRSTLARTNQDNVHLMSLKVLVILLMS